MVKVAFCTCFIDNFLLHGSPKLFGRLWAMVLPSEGYEVLGSHVLAEDEEGFPSAFWRRCCPSPSPVSALTPIALVHPVGLGVLLPPALGKAGDEEKQTDAIFQPRWMAERLSCAMGSRAHGCPGTFPPVPAPVAARSRLNGSSSPLSSPKLFSRESSRL